MDRTKLFKYDVFISYKSEQETWARRLAETLRQFGLKVWRDHDAGDGIRVSEDWSTEIQTGIRDSRRMIVLWSDLIQKNSGSVVHREIEEMRTLISADRTGQRKFVTINLDGTPLDTYQTLAPYHADVSFEGLYVAAQAGGAYRVSAVKWYGAINRLLEALDVRGVMEIRFVVAAMTGKQAQELHDEPDRYAQDPECFRLMLRLMGKTSDFNIGRYGDSPNDWQPFPQLARPLTIREIIEDYDQAKRVHAGNDARWILVSYSEEITSSDRDTQRMARSALASEPCLVILDPVSLMHRDIYQRIITAGGLAHHSEAFVLGAAPFVAQMHDDLFDTAREIDQRLSDSLASAYDGFDRPYEPGRRACVLNVEHEHQFVRWIQVAADGIVAANRTPMKIPTVHPSHRPRMVRRLVKAPGPEVVRMGAVEGNVP
jgi:hypothetical protein